MEKMCYTGGGRAVGIIGGGNYLDPDIVNYESNFQIARTAPTTRELQTGGGTFYYCTNPNLDLCADKGQSIEATLDAETIDGLAPGARIIFKSAPPPISNSDFLSREPAAIRVHQVSGVSL